MNGAAQLLSQSETDSGRVIAALVSGKKVTLFSNNVVAEGIEYEWQTPSLRIVHANGSSVPANWNDYSAMTVHG